MKRNYMDCPSCGSRLVVVGGDLLTMEAAQDDEMDLRIEQEKERWAAWEEAEPDGA